MEITDESGRAVACELEEGIATFATRAGGVYIVAEMTPPAAKG
jgi:hypothetical protein